MVSASVRSSRASRRLSDMWIAAGDEASRRWRTMSAKPTMSPRLPSPSALSRSARFISSRTYVGDLLVEGGLGPGEVVRHHVGVPGREERRPVELDELLLHQPAHQLAASDGGGAASDALRLCPANRSGSSRLMNSSKSSSLPLWGVAVRSRKCRVWGLTRSASRRRFVFLTSPENSWRRACGPRRRR